MQLFIVIFFWLFFGFLTAYIARSKGRDPKTWFLVGVLLGLLAIATILLVPRKKDTIIIAKNNKPAEPLPKVVTVQENPLLSQQWYYLDQNHQQYGPVYFSALKDLYQTQHISEGTFIWTEGMENWKKLDDHSELKGLVT